MVLTTSTAPDDVTGSYQAHANACKPQDLDAILRTVHSIDDFYLDLVQLAQH